MGNQIVSSDLGLFGLTLEYVDCTLKLILLTELPPGVYIR